MKSGLMDERINSGNHPNRRRSWSAAAVTPLSTSCDPESANSALEIERRSNAVLKIFKTTDEHRFTRINRRPPSVFIRVYPWLGILVTPLPRYVRPLESSGSARASGRRPLNFLLSEKDRF